MTVFQISSLSWTNPQPTLAFCKALAAGTTGDDWRRIPVGNTPQLFSHVFSHRLLCFDMNASVRKRGLRAGKKKKHDSVSSLAKRGLEKCVFCRRAVCFQTPSLSHQSSQVILWQLFCFIHQALENPSTSALEVTRWHQTCICKNTFTLHRLYFFPFLPIPLSACFLMVGQWPWQKTSHRNSDSAGTLLCPEKRPWNDV